MGIDLEQWTLPLYDFQELVPAAEKDASINISLHEEPIKTLEKAVYHSSYNEEIAETSLDGEFSTHPVEQWVDESLHGK